MTSRPRRSAAARANEVISVHAKWADTSEGSDTRERSTMSSRRSGRHSGASAIRDAPDSPGELSVEVASPRPRQSGRGGGRRSEVFEGGEIVHGKRNRGGKKSYVVDSSPDDEEEEEEEAEIDDDEDAEGEDDMELDAEGDDVDAEGDEDADGDIEMDTSVIHPTIKVSRPPKSTISAKGQPVPDDDDDEDDDELSDPGDSEPEDQTMGFGDETMADEDAEGEEIEVAGEEEEEEEEEEAEEGEERDSDEDGSRAGSPDLAKMTKRQRARFEDEPQQYMKLSDEVQVKKHFTAEELSMRRQEMARRRRNLSEKRTEEVKMETINKLLKKQAPKVNRKAAAAAAANGEAGEADGPRPSPVFIRWVNGKNGSRLAVPGEILNGPVGTVFQGNGTGMRSGKMVEEVA
ncbi:PAPA-1-like conserved region-domain-containing protein [Stachybotrys elegans]|uniref:PAPA-1-like conserved region-domain-containing protein n=1 Tax=Stachybotrys elegans TaxID=80388 RepID=A0A8K0WPY6_9HYPO|nr:PAPA-1-like conserved region-domain-containing protein [Stachybotrys elegans]